MLSSARVDARTHKRYLDYRDRHGYFGGTKRMLSGEEFAALDREHADLLAKEGRRDDEEELRFEELCRLLLRD